MPQLFFTDRAALHRSVTAGDVAHSLPAETITAAERFGLSDGMPFVLGSDGSYDHDLNRFFRACPTMGVRSLNSLKAYARDIVTWLRFLEERRGGKTAWQADRDDIAAFHEVRRLSGPAHRLAAASWNRAVAALDKLYGWGIEEGLTAVAPFTYQKRWARRVGCGAALVVTANRARERGARQGNVRFLDIERFLLFRDVGLRGRLPDGRPDPAARSRNGERNALFAEVLVTTGLRLEEASSLLTLELPHLTDVPAGARSVPVRLASATAKGVKGREYRLPVRLLRRMRHYVEVERANAAACLTTRACHVRMRRSIALVGQGHNGVVLDDGSGPVRVGLDLLRPAERHRLLSQTSQGGHEPALLWLTEGGRPMPPSSWQAVFVRASARCRAFGINLHVSPHMLRHSFAVHMLAMLIREQISWVLDSQGTGNERHGPAYRRLIGDPLLKLQRLMGHSSIESTYIYLQHLEESRELVEAAVERWSAVFSSDGDAL